MAEPVEPAVMVHQVTALAADLRELADGFDGQVREALSTSRLNGIQRVVLTGDGDSYSACCAAEMAFETLGDIACEPVSALRFTEYGIDRVHRNGPGKTLVVGISSSGSTERVTQAMRRARAHGALAVAVTGKSGSPVAAAADRSVIVGLPGNQRSPGIRTYQASLLGLLLLAVRLGESRGELSQDRGAVLRAEIAALSGAVAATAESVAAGCAEVADAIAGSPAMMMTGSGPSYGTALFAAAKVIEGAGVLATGQDLEEWCHVERFAYPLDMPVFVIAPPGRSRWRALGLAERATSLGRRVVAVASLEDTEIARHAWRALPVQGVAREQFSPLLYHVFASHLASSLAHQLQRKPLQSDI